MRRQSLATPRRLLIADEVGLGKTIEAGLIIRDLLLAEGSIDNFSCLYLTSGGLVEDAAEKLSEVLRGALGDRRLVQPVSSFREYGLGSTRGVFVASMHAARRYVTEKSKKSLPDGVAPTILIIDECHHASCGDDLGGASDILNSSATQTYKAAWQLMSGTYWADSTPPRLAILMSATPFRSKAQFVNLLRLLAHGAHSPGGLIDAFGSGFDSRELLRKLRDPECAVDVVWRRQDDPEVHSWSHRRLFPNLRIIRPHAIDATEDDPLDSPGPGFTDLLGRIKTAVQEIARNHDSTFGGFATAQLEKKLTSSSIAGACALFARCVRHLRWPTKNAFTSDNRESTRALRALIKKISRRLAEWSESRYATVRFASEAFEFPATKLSRAEHVDLIYDFNRKLLGQAEPSFWMEPLEVERICNLANELLDFGHSNSTNEIPVENAKLNWLGRMLIRHPDGKFLVFSESLQTCEILEARFKRHARKLIGSMSSGERRRAVRDLRVEPHVRMLVATSAADEGFDLQVANRIVHWDLSSSPATLMQRNGRVARLGQRSDVTAYYLVLPGTHEERRDKRLREKFVQLGIDDESMQAKILGLLTEDETDQLESAIERQDDRLIGQILRQARDDNQEMEEQLNAIAVKMTRTAVLDRDALAERLRTWEKIGLPDSEIHVKVSTVDWERPVFAERVRLEKSSSAVARVERGRVKKSVVFDPEFQVFGPESDYELAGLRPWAKSENRDRIQIRPDTEVDLLGDLLSEIVRLPAADLASLGADAIRTAAPRFAGARWLLFCTHPLREAETEWLDPTRERPYLTFYAFGEDGQTAAPSEWADAEEVRAVIKALERELVERRQPRLSTEELAAARATSERLGSWLQEHTHFFMQSFLAEPKRFVPMPVALLLVRDVTRSERQAPGQAPSP